MIQNYSNAPMLPGGIDPTALGNWLQQNGYATAPGSVPANGTPAPGMPGAPTYAPPQPGSGVVIDPRTGQPLQRPQGPDAGLSGWDGVSDKMRYLAQNARYNRLSAAAAKSQPGVSTSGMGGGGGGFGQLLHTIFGHSTPGAAQ